MAPAAAAAVLLLARQDQSKTAAAPQLYGTADATLTPLASCRLMQLGAGPPNGCAQCMLQHSSACGWQGRPIAPKLGWHDATAGRLGSQGRSNAQQLARALNILLQAAGPLAACCVEQDWGGSRGQGLRRQQGRPAHAGPEVRMPIPDDTSAAGNYWHKIWHVVPSNPPAA